MAKKSQFKDRESQDFITLAVDCRPALKPGHIVRLKGQNYEVIVVHPNQPVANGKGPPYEKVDLVIVTRDTQGNSLPVFIWEPSSGQKGSPE